MTDPAVGADVDVVVVGCGPAGATAGNLLGAAGLSALVLDAATEIVTIPRAIHFDASIMRVFQSIGLADLIEPDCRVLESMATYGAERQLLSDSTTGSGADGWADHYNFYQPVLEGTLRAGLQRFPQVDLQLGATVTALEQDPAGVTVRWVRDGAERATRARYAVGADGASSTVRSLLGVGLDDLDFDEPWLVVDALVPAEHRLPPATSQMFCDPARPTTLVPGPGRHRRWEFMLLPGEDPAVMGTAERVTELLSEYVDPGTVSIVRASVYRFHALIAHRWRVGRVLLAGDAAHQTPPFLGQGMCHGIRDVMSLSWRLRDILDGQSAETLLSTYQLEREPQVREIIDRAVLKGREICVLDPELAVKRDLAVAQRSEWGESLNTTLPLRVTTGLVHPSYVAGDGPLPQPLVLEPAGAERRLDDLLPRGWWVLTTDPALAPADSDPALPVVVLTDVRRADGAGLVDRSGVVGRWLERAGARAAVIRPDRHAYGFAADRAGLTEVADHLRRRRAGQP